MSNVTLYFLSQFYYYYVFQDILSDGNLLNNIDWTHLSNLVYAYDSCCVKTYLEQRLNIDVNGMLDEVKLIQLAESISMSVVQSLSVFFRSLPAFRSLSQHTQYLLYKNNIRRLFFPNLHELNQSCFSESWQVICLVVLNTFILKNETIFM